ncbi:hypothetical protein K0I63_15840 [Shewanella rhizosphaerae]|uniref:hypothetical protein n=1 Tax=Shewanella rhizosphaerae TaxID=2864207 RepID=UPI001C6607DA|nr:hypothetical protein [Shewanella rhizosphaerae]QYK12198.1 hypothetical protein K0I63_15840 [Shewanella rhizosphaerae]
MQQGFPITITADDRFSSSLKPLLAKLEMWINFQALKADWYGKEDHVLTFDFTLLRTLDEKAEQLSSENWIVEPGYAYHYENCRLMTIAFIAVDDLVERGTGIEQEIKSRLVAVANAVGLQHGFIKLS